MSHRVRGIIVSLALAFSVNCFADRLRIDFNQTGASDYPVHTQEDFDSFILKSGGGTTTWRFGTVGVTISADLGNGLDDRRRTVLTNSLTFTNAQLLQDFIFNQGATQVNGGLSVRITGLHSNAVHSCAVWCYDSASLGTRVSDWYANGVLVKNNHTFNGAVRPTSNSDYKFTFNATSDANGEILIQGRRDATSVDEGGAAATAVFLNGLEINGIPDQSPPCGTTQHLQPGSNLYGWTAGGTFAEQDAEVAALKEAGVRWARINVAWHGVEATGKGIYDAPLLALYDHLMAKLGENGIKAIFVTADTPYWASSDTNKTNNIWDPKYKPANFDDLADYYVFLLNRYASTGPHAFEIWNEQNASYFWPSGVDATNYVSMLRTCYTAIKNADPDAIVLNGGLTDGSNATNYMAAMYSAGAKPYFDAWSQHTYPRTPQYESIVSKVRDVMVQNGDAAKKIWMTECGWMTYTNTTNATPVSYPRQAHYLTNLFTRFASYPEIEVVTWYTSRSYDETTHEGSFGLMFPDFTKKPSYDAFKDWVTLASKRCYPEFISLSPPQILTNGTARLQFTADPQFIYTVQSSSNLSQWQTLATNIASTNQSFVFEHSNATNAASRFYRVLW